MDVRPFFLTYAIANLWDQTIEGDSEDTFLGYGTEYTKEQIEEALKSDVPQQKVPSKDESGHGTFLAGLIAGNEDNETGFSGIAPNAGLIVVKLRKAKDYLKEYYCMIQNTKHMQKQTSCWQFTISIILQNSCKDRSSYS